MVKEIATRKAHSRKAKKQTAEDVKADDQKKPPRKDGMRETVESVVVAFILAFLFRTFEAEAFVIPTGSMAPTLYGRHKEIECEKCHFVYAIGASDEVDKDGFFGHRIQTAFCPNCRYEMSVENWPVFKGDRILVNKFPYEYSEPHRWDVVVFKYPEEPQTNYIKRLVGLPGETLQIQQGNVYVLTDGEWNILRKQDPNKQRVLQLLVYDNDHPETELHAQGWPRRWAAVRRDGAPESIAGWSKDDSGWKRNAKQHSFQLDRDRTSDGELRWIRYRHIVPTQQDWDVVSENPPSPPTANPRPQLISDFCGYNAYTGGVPTDRGYYWVGDLTLSCELELLDVGSGGVVLLELNKGARQFRCRIDVATGEASISHTVSLNRAEDEEKLLATAKTDVNGVGVHDLTFANVDDRLCLWVDDRLVDFGAGAEYKPHAGLRTQSPWEDDLIPVGIAARGVGVRVSHLLIQRDTYYRNEFVHPRDQFHNGYADTVREYDGYEENLRDLLSDPQAWYQEYDSKLSRNLEKFEDLPFKFELGPGEFFMMGDNSPRSKDSRLWPNTRFAKHRHAVPRSALVGKAFYIYWPHGVPFLNDGKGYPVRYHYRKEFHDGRVTVEKTDYPSFRIPFYPHVSRMHRIR